MITIKDGNLFDATKGVICHQVNCRGVMGAGVAAQFKKKFPMSYRVYKDWCSKYRDGILLGKCCICSDSGYTTCSMFAQTDYGRARPQTNYDAFRNCCTFIKDYLSQSLDPTAIPINMPYNIGCGLAGGDWDIIYQIIREELTDGQ